ncbi:MAG: GAF domain-containing SpoIIE family protein phosphatase [Acidobacteriota bacterium]
MGHTSSKRHRYPAFWRKKVALLGDLKDSHRASTVDQLLAAFTQLLKRELGASHVAFSILDGRKQEYFYQTPEALRGRTVVPGEGFSSQAIQARRCLRFDAQDISAQAFPEFPIIEPIRTAMVAPIMRENQVLGTVEVINRSGESGFSKSDRQYLEALSSHMALFLNNFLLAEEAERRKKEEGHLREIARSLNTSFDLDEILGEILSRVKEVIDCDAAVMILLPVNEEGRRITVYGTNVQDLEQLRTKADEIYAHWSALGSRSTLLSRQDYGEVYSTIRATTQSVMLIPLKSRDRLLGLFTLVSDESGAYSKDDLELLTFFGNHASLAIERAHTHASVVEKSQLERELKIAREIQLRFLPAKMPEISGLELSARNVPSRMVSGDLYDLIPIVAGQWGIVIGDVSGKGISAGLILAAFRSALLAEIRNNFSIGAILSKVNRLLWETTDPSRFVTCFYGVFDETNRVLTYSNAGHNPPLLLRADGRSEWLRCGGILLGAFSEATYSEERVLLLPGDLLILYTDGLTELRKADGEELGGQGLEDLVRPNALRSASEISEILAREVARRSHSSRPQDDATFVVIKVASG